MQHVAAVPLPSLDRPLGTGGFLDPERIVDNFNIKEGMKIADFGSGGGYFTIILAEKIGPQGKIYALDIQEDKLDSLRAKASAHGLDNIETVRTNLEILGSSSLPDGSVDVVLLANILFQSKKHEDIIKEGKRILRSGGEMILIDWKSSSGGFGPPDSIRLDQDLIKKTAEGTGLVFERKLDAGQFHFGLIFRRS